MVLSQAERMLIQNIVSNAMTYNNMVALAAQEDHNCHFHREERPGACYLRDSLEESAKFALDDFNKAMERLKPFTGHILE